MSEPVEPPSLDAPYSLGDEKYKRILTTLSNRKICHIVEFGSGKSTIRLSLDFPNATVLAIEHDEYFYQRTDELLRLYEVKNGKVLRCPLRHIRVGLRVYLTYDLHLEKDRGGVDLVVIDGPPESQTLRGREAPLYMIFPLLNENALIVLDDYHRASANAVVRNWLNTYPDSLNIVEKNEQFIILEKCNTSKNLSFPGFQSVMDNWLTNVQLSHITLKKFGKLAIQRIGRLV